MYEHISSQIYVDLHYENIYMSRCDSWLNSLFSRQYTQQIAE
jgi:hypothetical protein